MVGDPQASDLWRLIDQHFDSFQQVYAPAVPGQVRLLETDHRAVGDSLSQVRRSA